MSTDAVATALGAPVTRLPESPSLARAHRHGQPIAVLAPDGSARDRLTELADAVHSAVRS
jgi:MinD-like ATPase involved in chromosome partitioning or flagellar assembly